jgi:hypothetical protein
MPGDNLRWKVLVPDVLFRLLEASSHFDLKALQFLVFPAQRFHFGGDIDTGQGLRALGLQPQFGADCLEHFLARLAGGSRCRRAEHVRHRRLRDHFLENLMNFVERPREALFP